MLVNHLRSGPPAVWDIAKEAVKNQPSISTLILWDHLGFSKGTENHWMRSIKLLNSALRIKRDSNEESSNPRRNSFLASKRDVGNAVRQFFAFKCPRNDFTKVLKELVERWVKTIEYDGIYFE
ncbi:hypothetical protein EVAR_31851_1 [Eumeta japonica]|uniref:Uncharacterized protein n=1 Tax=Eumeta variegata TaxID=151549 RepID=A0A4C1Z2S0_EUMVA|nr:hypothetical protein EVAR_31851_1 [Eumeta japonica]